MNKLWKISVAVGIALLFSCMVKDMTYDEAVDKLDSLVDRADVYDSYITRGSELAGKDKPDLLNTLPEISQYPITVNPVTSGEVVEIFSSTEKAGTTKPDNWLTQLADEFNRKRVSISNGRTAQVQIRSIPSGTGFQFIASGKAVPNAFTPSNHLWIKMVQAYGKQVVPVTEKLLDNPAGIVMKKETYNAFEEKWGKVDVKNLINAVAQGELAMGYTNPFASSTGLNFLITVLAVFADNDESRMLTPEVISAFEAFQEGVPFVSLTTLQMRESVENNGSLDTFVMEYQTFVNVPQLKSYKFIPFGVNHDNPLYAVGDNTSAQMEVLKAFANYIQSSKATKLATQYGFSKADIPSQSYTVPSGDTLVEAQQIWKEKKDAGRPILAVFLADVSGSMYGEPILALKKGLVEGFKFISPNNYIGLVSFSSEVNRLVKIKPFNSVQQAILNTGAQNLSAEGGTAMYDGVVASLQMLVEAKAQVPNGKPILIVLTDGENREGLGLSAIKSVVKGLKIPIYTIGYNANISALNELSSINEAATINAHDENIAYQLGSLLNAQL